MGRVLAQIPCDGVIAFTLRVINETYKMSIFPGSYLICYE